MLKLTLNYVDVNRYLGLILRSQIITMLEHQCWGNRTPTGTDQPLIDHAVFVRKYPQRRPLYDLNLPDDSELQTLWVDLSTVMNRNSYTTTRNALLNRVYIMFRGLGLRHIPVLDVGIFFFSQYFPLP